VIDTKAKRAAALGYGLSFLLVIPPADGTIDIEDAGHALSAYRFNLPELTIADPLPLGMFVASLDYPEMFVATLDYPEMSTRKVNP
jgi:hypothetical protein